MVSHPILPGIVLERGLSHPAFNEYLREWRERASVDADAGRASASVCQQATLIDVVLEGRPKYDWLSVMEDLLTDADGIPLAYSASYGELLYKFADQLRQSTVHSIYTRWWVETLSNSTAADHSKFADLILAKKGSDGLIYDYDVSPTILRHRMKAEISMSAVMGAEILLSAGCLTDDMRLELATSLCDPRKLPPFGYMIGEQFRLAALRILDYEEQFPVGIGEHIKACEVGLECGWGDFSMVSKVDAYMGTAKRTSRDKPIHSPLVACHVAVLADKVDNINQRASITDRMKDYAKILYKTPLDIPAFQMRDVPIRFGADLTPIEAVCASHIIAKLTMEVLQ